MGSAIGGRGIVSRLEGYLGTGIWERRPAEVFRAQLKIVRRKKGESLTDLAMENRRLVVMAFREPTDKTTEIVARDVFLDALDDPELTTQIHTQQPRDLVKIAQSMEVAMRSLSSRASKPVRTIVQGGDNGKFAANLKDLRTGRGTCSTRWSS